jgi:hypothetical protein
VGTHAYINIPRKEGGVTNNVYEYNYHRPPGLRMCTKMVDFCLWGLAKPVNANALYICMHNEITVIGHCSTIISRGEGGNLLSNEWG